MHENAFSGFLGHELIVEQVWGDGTRVFLRGLATQVEGSLVHLTKVDRNYDPSPAYALTIANAAGDDDHFDDPRDPLIDFADYWVNLSSIAVMSLVDVTATRPDLVFPGRR